MASKTVAGPAAEVVYLDVSEFIYLAFWGIVMLFSSSFAAASLGGAVPYPRQARFGYAYTPPLYTIEPTRCDMNVYNMSSPTAPISTPYLGVWNLWLKFGACPTENLPTTCKKLIADDDAPHHMYCGNQYAGCMSMYFGRQQMQNDFIAGGGPTWSDTYSHTPFNWIDLDNMNEKAGYATKFVGGSLVWDSLANLAIAATVLQFVSLFVYTASVFFKVLLFQSRVVSVVLSFVSCLFWIITLGLPSTTSQLDSKAWSTAFFQTCTVTIEKGPIYHYVTFIIASTAAFVFSEIGFMVYYSYIADDRRPTFRALATVELKNQGSV